MPATPFHLGPGAAIKVFIGRHLSFTVFTFTQIVIDLESATRFLHGDEVLHGFSHTYLGATVVGFIGLFVGKPVCESCLRLWNSRLSKSQQRWLYIPPSISWVAASAGAFIGVYSHILLDSIMHSDMSPFAPLSAKNGMLYVITIDELHALCSALGLFGVTVLLLVALWNNLREKPERKV
jgi:hypothetical protein